MNVKLAIKLWEGQEYAFNTRNEVLYRSRVPWTAVPPVGGTLQCGISEDGEKHSLTGVVTGVWWGTDGTVWVEAPIVNLQGEFDDARDDLVRDGFTDYRTMTDQEGSFVSGDRIIDVNEPQRGVGRILSVSKAGTYVITYPDGTEVLNVPGSHLKREE